MIFKTKKLVFKSRRKMMNMPTNKNITSKNKREKAFI